MKIYYIYILECEDNKLYTGITTDYKRRFLEHSGSKKGAKYTHSFSPIRFLLLYKTIGRKNASLLEYYIKKLKKAEKLLLISNSRSFNKLLSDKVDKRNYRRCRL